MKYILTILSGSTAVALSVGYYSGLFTPMQMTEIKMEGGTFFFKDIQMKPYSAKAFKEYGSLFSQIHSDPLFQQLLTKYQSPHKSLPLKDTSNPQNKAKPQDKAKDQNQESSTPSQNQSSPSKPSLKILALHHDDYRFLQKKKKTRISLGVLLKNFPDSKPAPKQDPNKTQQKTAIKPPIKKPLKQAQDKNKNKSKRISGEENGKIEDDSNFEEDLNIVKTSLEGRGFERECVIPDGVVVMRQSKGVLGKDKSKKSDRAALIKDFILLKNFVYKKKVPLFEEREVKYFDFPPFVHEFDESSTRIMFPFGANKESFKVSSIPRPVIEGRKTILIQKQIQDQIEKNKKTFY